MGRYPTVASKLEILEFIASKETATLGDLVNQFGYTAGAAAVRLCRLEHQRLIEKMWASKEGYCLTSRAYERLESLRRSRGKTYSQLLNEIDDLRRQLAEKESENQGLKNENIRLKTELSQIKSQYY
ncbi:hypothetical protein Dform_00480 [Dehalogenimonas formicexedens]|uniref:Uncharacterized protein n=3 Tax=Dehalogenimonas TaxID=670486 RepID=A0A1P8F5X8_9CHLR|nr:hypothetical protein [Dehalogenimonas formicexedens]APV43835.1 hypothetical protein Dform_00480 [Dehalogenimonas formicexedens]KTB49277.1 hypothetical protein DEALK_01900 [Dehalogenimonas alkenigignens]